MLKSPVRNITWRFCDSRLNYPELADKPSIYVSKPEEVYSHFRFLFVNQVRERFLVIWLNTANRVLGFEVVTEGTVNASLVHPREVFRGAIVSTSSSIVVAHNHPSGNPEPSQEDLSITRQLVESGKIIGIPVYDHVIFTNHKFTSFAERGIL